MEKEADVALTIPALVAERIAAHGNEIVLRKKDRGIWQAVTWTQLGSSVADVSRGLAAIGFGAGDVACVLAETRPDYVYVDLGILDVGGVSGGIHPAIEPEQLGEALQQSRCSVLFVENEEQLDKALLVRDRCPELQRIIIFDMKGLREFSDTTCESYRAFIARGAEHRTDSTAAVTDDQPAILLLPQGRLLTHGDVLHLLAQARSLLQPRVHDERLALLPMCSVMEHVFGLYLALDAQVISNYLESPDTILENLQEVQPTLLGADTQLWQLLYARATAVRRRCHPCATRPVSLGDRCWWQHAATGLRVERGAARAWARPRSPRLCRCCQTTARDPTMGSRTRHRHPADRRPGDTGRCHGCALPCPDGRSVQHIEVHKNI